MGYDGENVRSPIIVDVETAALPNAAEYLEPVQAAKNLVDPVKIKADIEARTKDRDAKLALDRNVGRIVAMGWWTEERGTEAHLALDEASEKTLLMLFWREAANRSIVGFNVKGFDLPYMIQRSRYLGCHYPTLDLGKYGRSSIRDLYLDLTFNEGTYDQGAMRRTLHAFCRRFGIPVEDTITGAEVPALVEAGDWDAVEAHVRADIELTVALAMRLGAIRSAAVLPL